jgi:hypothetical protein
MAKYLILLTKEDKNTVEMTLELVDHGYVIITF